jgi:hypothetical protein
LAGHNRILSCHGPTNNLFVNGNFKPEGKKSKGDTGKVGPSGVQTTYSKLKGKHVKKISMPAGLISKIH